MLYRTLFAVLLLITTSCQRDLNDELEASPLQDPVFHEIAAAPQLMEAESFFIDPAATLRKRYVTFDSTQMLAAVATESDVHINLFDDYELVAQTAKVDTRKGVHTWNATVKGANYSQVCLSFAGEHIMGIVHVDDEIFQIQPLGDGRHVIAEVIQSNMPDGDCQKIVEVDHFENHVGDPPSTNKIATNFIKVMLVIPEDDLSGFCNTSWLKNILEVQAENSLNNAFSTGPYQTNCAAEVVIYCTSYSPSKDSETDLNWLSLNPTIATMRSQLSADLVCMFVSKLNGSCGRGENPVPVSNNTSNLCHSVVQYSCAFSKYSFPHEIGHNLGMHHDRYEEGGGTSARCYYGYVYAYNGNSGRSIMAYDTWCDDNGGNCTRQGRYSYGKYSGIYGIDCSAGGVGITGSADNVSQLIEAYPYVVDYN